MNRREFLGVSASGCALPILRPLAPVGAATPRRHSAPGKNIAQRKNLSKLTKEEWELFESAIIEMKNQKNNLGYNQFANFHNTSCAHRNWFFFPWHRAYLYYFEVLCRKLTKESFALPYWDWSTDRAVPQRFLDKKSPLYFEDRALKGKDFPTEADIGSKAISDLLATSSFRSFGGTATDLKANDSRTPGAAGGIEGGPHNIIHEYVGRAAREGDKHSAMFGNRAALDPLFWVHHANLDRIWMRWCVTELKGRTKQWPSQKGNSWAATKFEFVTVNAVDKSIFVEDCLSTYDLGYTYDEFAKEEAKTGAKRLDSVVKFLNVNASAVNAAEQELGAALNIKRPAVMTLKPSNVFLKNLRDNLAESSKKGTHVESRVRIEFQSVPHGGGRVRVFVNNPDANSSTRVTDPSYAGFISFFSPHSAHKEDDPKEEYILDIGKTLAKFEVKEDATITVTCVAEGWWSDAPDALIRRISVEIAEQT
ncbi:tyrosinase family protein [Frigoriglobus tundricola]|uniref:Tyrosinase copper-binding domain-containing protein n=1 Tax=Frigoriglobus tundricola TaxID=2774151 RepID=A0A6M5YW59_9BACT|nr:tyrosinase family protein [Frigoriglobus tundricola]QJW98179.1 hypothetical protein FTUN_5759 [Frigoriglobus tundricola]